jgi:hypothetical protein
MLKSLVLRVPFAIAACVGALGLGTLVANADTRRRRSVSNSTSRSLGRTREHLRWSSYREHLAMT